MLAFLAGCVPSLIVFFWLRNSLNKQNDLNKKNCDRMLASGSLTTILVLALSEELSKYYMFRRKLKNIDQ